MQPTSGCKVLGYYFPEDDALAVVFLVEVFLVEAFFLVDIFFAIVVKVLRVQRIILLSE